VGVGVDGVKERRSEEAGQFDVIVGFVYFGIDDNTGVVLFAAEDIGETTTGTDLFEKEFFAAHEHALPRITKGPSFVLGVMPPDFLDERYPKATDVSRWYGVYCGMSLVIVPFSKL
jgi:hypothetical protein